MVWAQNTSSNPNGNIESDQGTYFLEDGKTTLVKISGTGENANANTKEKVFLIITSPDSSKQTHQIFSTGEGYFEIHIPLTINSQTGTYEVFSSFKNDILDTIYFQVEKAPSGYTAPLSMQQYQSSSITAITNNAIYEKGESVHISGTVDKVDMITLQVTNPKHSLVQIHQIMPTSDGTYSIILNTKSPLWKLEGDYKVRVNSGGDETEVMFYVTNPKVVISNPITVPQSAVTSNDLLKTTLTLKVGKVTKISLSTAEIPISGTLTAIDWATDANGNLLPGMKKINKPVSYASIDIINADSRSKITTIQTGNDGTFSTSQQGLSGKFYKFQAVYHGASEYEPSKSAHYGVTVPSTQQPTPTTPASPIQSPSTQSAGGAPIETGLITLIVLMVGIIGIIGIIVFTRKKKKQKVPQYVKVPPKAPRKAPQRAPPTSPNPSGNTESSTMFFYECPKCHGANIQNNPDGSVYCPDCRFRG
jgi:hypothetical protein